MRTIVTDAGDVLTVLESYNGYARRTFVVSLDHGWWPDPDSLVRLLDGRYVHGKNIVRESANLARVSIYTD